MNGYPIKIRALKLQNRRAITLVGNALFDGFENNLVSELEQNHDNVGPEAQTERPRPSLALQLYPLVRGV